MSNLLWVQIMALTVLNHVWSWSCQILDLLVPHVTRTTFLGTIYGFGYSGFRLSFDL